MSSLNRFRLITFDVTNTLLQLRSTPGKQYGEIGALFGVRCNNDDLVKNFKNNWHKMNRFYPNFGRNSSLLDWREWWRQLISNSFAESGAKIPAEKLEAFSNHIMDLYTTSTCWQHCNGSLDFLNYLKIQQQLQAKITKEFDSDTSSSFILGVISNFDPRLSSLLKNLKISHYFEFTLNSYNCKVEKPDKDIYNLAIQAADLKDLKPTECLHIGDGPITDYIGARDAGWHAALIHERNVDYLLNKYGNKIDPNYVFQSLYDFHKKISNNNTSW